MTEDPAAIFPMHYFSSAQETKLTVSPVPIGAVLAFWALFCPWQLSADEASGAFVNSLGMSLVPVEGQPVKLASQLTTVEQWNAFLQSTGHPWQPSHQFEQSTRHPAVGINRDDALAFCQWLTEREQAAGRLNERQQYRLPFHSEWEAAADLGDGAAASLSQRAALEASYLWGPQWPPPANVGNLGSSEIPGYEDPYNHTSPVDRFPPNPQGLYDMVGNAWEWMMDQGLAGRADLRGGSWADFNPNVLRATYRYNVPDQMRSPTVGFRVALDDLDRTQQMLAAGRQAAQQAARQINPHLGAGYQRGEGDEVGDAMRRILGSGAPIAPGGQVTDPVAGGERPQPNQAWRNSNGSTLIPVAGINVLVAIHEVRVEEFAAFASDTGLRWSGRPSFAQDVDHAAAGMTAREAEAFCQWLTERERQLGLLSPQQRYRLPTDEEWTVMAGGDRETADHPAARAAAGSPDTYFGALWPPPFGSGNFEAMRIEGYRDRFNFTAPVGSFRPNVRQLYDIEGNVAEWVSDTWQPGSTDRVARGGSWLTHRREEFAVSHRRRVAADQSDEDIGFRYVLEVAADQAGP